MSAVDDYKRAHRAADTDFQPDSIHHTLGPSGTEAAPGNHIHADYEATLGDLENDDADHETRIIDLEEVIPTLLVVDAVVVYATATQTLTTGTITIIAFDTEESTGFLGDPFSEASLAAETITVSVAGIYTIIGTIAYAAGATGFRQASIYINGTEAQTQRLPAAAAGGTFGVTAVGTFKLNANDVITLRGQQTQGANLATVVTAKGFVRLSVCRVA